MKSLVTDWCCWCGWCGCWRGAPEGGISAGLASAADVGIRATICDRLARLPGSGLAAPPAAAAAAAAADGAPYADGN